ncbi:hypothetical protein [Parafrigoribacterium soli]|uniref:hypothetical protein n=1 Tax=Parafrigoribacterium soli TaxID=3144663 RepID=UPI0032EBF5C7
MTFAPFARRWAILIVGSIFFLAGLAILVSGSTLAFGWASYAPLSGMAFYPGLPASESMLHGAALSPARYASFSGQISITLGIALIAGWTGYVFGKRARHAPAIEHEPTMLSNQY